MPVATHSAVVLLAVNVRLQASFVPAAVCSSVASNDGMTLMGAPVMIVRIYRLAIKLIQKLQTFAFSAAVAMSR